MSCRWCGEKGSNMCKACRDSEKRGFSKSYTLQNIRTSRGNWNYCQECKKREDLSSADKHSCYEAPAKKRKHDHVSVPVKSVEKYLYNQPATIWFIIFDFLSSFEIDNLYLVRKFRTLIIKYLDRKIQKNCWEPYLCRHGYFNLLEKIEIRSVGEACLSGSIPLFTRLLRESRNLQYFHCEIMKSGCYENMKSYLDLNPKYLSVGWTRSVLRSENIETIKRVEKLIGHKFVVSDIGYYWIQPVSDNVVRHCLDNFDTVQVCDFAFIKSDDLAYYALNKFYGPKYHGENIYEYIYRFPKALKKALTLGFPGFYNPSPTLLYDFLQFWSEEESLKFLENCRTNLDKCFELGNMRGSLKIVKLLYNRVSIEFNMGRVRFIESMEFFLSIGKKITKEDVWSYCCTGNAHILGFLLGKGYSIPKDSAVECVPGHVFDLLIEFGQIELTSKLFDKLLHHRNREGATTMIKNGYVSTVEQYLLFKTI